MIKKNALLELVGKNLRKGAALDVSKLNDLDEHEVLIAKIIAEETEKERNRRRGVNPLLKTLGVDSRDDYEIAYANSKNWDELLTRPAVVAACSVRAKTSKVQLLEFVCKKCNPTNWDAVFWMTAWYQELEHNKSNGSGKSREDIRKEAQAEVEQKRAEEATKKARAAAVARHGKPGGSWELARKIRASWASGIFATREECVDEEWEAIGFARRSTARDALQGEPNPDPWIGKKKKAPKR